MLLTAAVLIEFFMSPLTVSSLNTTELDQAAFVVTKSFLDKPADHIKAVWRGGNDKILKQNQHLFSLLLKSANKEVYVVKDAQEILAVYAIQHSRHCHLGLWQQAKILLPMLRAVGSNLPRLIHWHDRWESVEPSEDHWHLSPMCVKPGAQGLGIGKLMLQHLCQLLDQRRGGGYLETGKWENVLFYKKYGFTVQQEVNIYTAKTWTMWREPLLNE